jgi:hypothetical protein
MVMQEVSKQKNSIFVKISNGDDESYVIKRVKNIEAMYHILSA